MSDIGHRTHYRGYPHVRGTVVGMYGPDVCLVDWDDVTAGTRREHKNDLVILDETASFDDGLVD